MCGIKRDVHVNWVSPAWCQRLFFLLMNEEAHKLNFPLLNSLRMSGWQKCCWCGEHQQWQLPEKCSGVAFKAGGDCLSACLGMKLIFSYHPVFPSTPHACSLVYPTAKRLAITVSISLRYCPFLGFTLISHHRHQWAFSYRCHCRGHLIIRSLCGVFMIFNKSFRCSLAVTLYTF